MENKGINEIVIQNSSFVNDSKQREVDPIPHERPVTPREPGTAPATPSTPEVIPIPQTNPITPVEPPQVIPPERSK
ncbi:MAG: hypothetical protein ABI723_12090 [Bacteroidia bacterium]